MRYVSTRGGMPPQPFTSILIEGLAPDGGLVVPDRYPRLTTQDLARMRHLGYQDLAFEILSRYIDDIAPADLKSIIARTYTVATFGSEEIAPLATLEPGLHLLRLANGPTLAFKDIALQLLGNLFEHVLAKEGATLNILGATSGDTGSSAEYAMRGKRGISVFMLSPRGRMTAFQTAQMYALSEPNIFNIAIEGVFDDCQDIVKKIAGDREFKRRWHLGAVNSINWARVAAQVVYYFKAYFAATRNEEEAVAFAVPSGNFGNILAGHVARQMGLPIRRLIVATNENDVLDEFFRTGRYMARDFAKVVATSSPSMDISKASNFERLVFDLADRDPATVLALWDQLDREGGFDVSGTPLAAKLRTSSFVSGRSTHADRITTIRSIAEKHRVVVDPHTADGIKVGLANREPGVPLICVETALPVKFAQTIAEALGREPERPRAYIGLEELPQRCAVLGVDADAVKAYIAEHALA